MIVRTDLRPNHVAARCVLAKIDRASGSCVITVIGVTYSIDVAHAAFSSRPASHIRVIHCTQTQQSPEQQQPFSSWAISRLFSEEKVHYKLNRLNRGMNIVGLTDIPLANCGALCVYYATDMGRLARWPGYRRLGGE